MAQRVVNLAQLLEERPDLKAALGKSTLAESSDLDVNNPDWQLLSSIEQAIQSGNATIIIDDDNEEYEAEVIKDYGGEDDFNEEKFKEGTAGFRNILSEYPEAEEEG